MEYLQMDPNKRHTTEALIGLIPPWVEEGGLVYVNDFLEEDIERIGLILDYYVIDVDKLTEEEYNDLIYYEEWLLMDISSEVGIFEAVQSSIVSPVTLKIKVGENNA